MLIVGMKRHGINTIVYVVASEVFSKHSDVSDSTSQFLYVHSVGKSSQLDGEVRMKEKK